MGSVNDPRNIIGLSHLMADNNPDIDIDELEKTIMNGAKDIQTEETDLASQYKVEMQSLTRRFGIGLGDDSDSPPDVAKDENTSDMDAFNELYPQNNYQASKPPIDDYEYKFKSVDDGFVPSDTFRPSNTFRPSDSSRPYQDQHLNNLTEEQEKRSNLNRVFANISNRDKIYMDNYDLMGDREHEDKQMLLAEIDELRDDLMQMSIDLSRVKEVDNNSSIEDIREVHRKLVYKTNSNSYSGFADELFIIVAQGAEYAFNGQREWFGHKPDLTGWGNTVRGKLRRMKYAKAKIVRRIIDEYQIPEWLQIGIEIIPTAFTHSRHRRSAVRDSVVNNSVYQDAIHNLNNLMD